MANTPREKFLVLLLPSCLIALIYAWWIQDKKQPSLAQMRQGLDAARVQAIQPTVVTQQQLNLVRVQRELAELEKQKQRLTADWKSVAALCTQSANRPERADRFTAMVHRNRLTLIDSGPADLGKDIRLSPSLQQLSKLLADPAGGKQLQVWRYRVQGSYANVLRTLEELNREEPSMAIPIGLTMKDADPDYNGREWTLLVWI